MAKFTSGHCRLIAQVLQSQYPIMPSEGELQNYNINLRRWQMDCQAFADRLSANNERFDHAKFMVACLPKGYKETNE